MISKRRPNQIEIELSAQADHDIADIVKYLAMDDPEAARRFFGRLTERIVQLSRFPKLGRMRSDIGDNVRALLISPYIALYRIVGLKLVVLRIVHGSRDLSAATLVP